MFKIYANIVSKNWDWEGVGVSLNTKIANMYIIYALSQPLYIALQAILCQSLEVDFDSTSSTNSDQLWFEAYRQPLGEGRGYYCIDLALQNISRELYSIASFALGAKGGALRGGGLEHSDVVPLKTCTEQNRACEWAKDCFWLPGHNSAIWSAEGQEFDQVRI